MNRSGAGSVLVVVALAVAGCAGSSPAHVSTPDLAKRYMSIATPANTVLDKSFDALSDHKRDGDGVSASVPLLRTIALTERTFDRELLALKLPAQMGTTAAALVTANEARGNLTTQATTATSVPSLNQYETELDAMNAPVEAQVRILRKDLGLPPSDTD